MNLLMQYSIFANISLTSNCGFFAGSIDLPEFSLLTDACYNSIDLPDVSLVTDVWQQ